MSRKNRSPEEKARRGKIRELLQMANIDSMDDIQDLFKETIAEFMENGVEAELDEDIGYSKYRFGFEDDLDHTLKETAKHFHLSVSRAKSTEKSALTNFE